MLSLNGDHLSASSKTLLRKYHETLFIPPFSSDRLNFSNLSSLLWHKFQYKVPNLLHTVVHREHNWIQFLRATNIYAIDLPLKAIWRMCFFHEICLLENSRRRISFFSMLNLHSNTRSHRIHLLSDRNLYQP